MRCKAVGAAALVLMLGLHEASSGERDAARSDASDLAPRWWQWRISLPALAVPDKDLAGHFCDVGQSRETWFLGSLLTTGTSTGPIRRTCVIPSGRPISFPIVTALRIVSGAATCEKAKAQVSQEVDQARKLFVTLDGTNLPLGVRERSGTKGSCFPLLLRADGPSASLTAAADGYWMTIGPLATGHHMLAFGGDFEPAPDRRETRYDLDVR